MLSVNRSLAAALAAFLSLGPAGTAAAQELIAWPIGTNPALSVIMPGVPVRPLPPRILPPRPIPPRPIPHPVPAPIPAPIPAPPAVSPSDSRPLSVSGYGVEGKITGNVSELAYTVTFHNPTDRRLEGVLLMPVPADTVLSGFTMTVGGKKLNAELLEADQAASIYQSIVRSLQDPGLLELVGERMVRARVFPIEPNSDIVVRMQVSQILRQSGGLYSLTIPMRSAKMTGATAKGSTVKLSLAAENPIRTVYSPLPEARIVRSGARAAEIEFTAAADAANDFTLFYSLDKDPLAAGLLTFREDGEDGYFLLSLSPQRETAAKDVVPKDIVFVVDRSGSMEEGGKMAQAKDALSYCIAKLSAADRFGIVDFATDSSVFESSLVPASEDNKKRALRYLSRLESAGGTNIESAIEESLKLLSEAPGRIPMLFFMTDGLPTVGRTQTEELLRMASERNKGLRARLFSFGVGEDVNTLFLDKLAEMNRGAGDYVAPGENIETKVSALYTKVARPALTDVRVEWQGVEGFEMYPRPVTDIFYGAELVLMGRHKGHGTGKLVVTGKNGAEEVRFVYPVAFPERADRNAFLPRLWANLKVAHELDALRLAGGQPDPEVVDGIVRLAKRHGIVTRFTSFLITEEGFDLPRAREEAQRSIGRMRADAAMSGFGGGGGVSRRAQRDSGFFAGASDAFIHSSSEEAPPAPRAFRAPRDLDSGEPDAARPKAMPAPEPEFRPSAPAALERIIGSAEKEARSELKDKGVHGAQTRTVAGKTFYLRDGVWVDGAFDPAAGLKTISLKTMSEEYFALLEMAPSLGRCLALGPKVTVVHNGTVYTIAN